MYSDDVLERKCIVDRVLTISSNAHALDVLRQLVLENGFQDVSAASSGNEARSMFSGGDFGLVMVDVPLSDESGVELAAEILQSSPAGVMLVVRPEVEAEIEARVSDCGALVLTKPLSKKLFGKAVRLMEATKKRISGVRNENVKLQKKIDDIRIIGRAKGILMEYLSMTEPQAHKYLEKQAMDLRLTKAEVAKNLLSTYDS